MDLHNASANATRDRAKPVMLKPEPIVFVVDDDISVRESVGALLCFSGWQVVALSSAEAFLSFPRPNAPGCLVLDVNLPNLDGLGLQEKMAADQIALPIVFITGQGDIPTTVRAIKAGAVEFLTKPLDRDALLRAVREAIERNKQALAEKAELDAVREQYATLSQRERDVLVLIVDGLLNKQVGGELGISEATVKAHRGQVMRKMKAQSFADLVSKAAQLGLGAAARH